MSLMDSIRRLFDYPEEEEYEEEEEFLAHEGTSNTGVTVQPEQSSRRNKVVNIHATTQLAVVLVKPERFDDARSIADHLNAKRTVRFESGADQQGCLRRLIDFLSGVAYANNGQIQPE